MELARLLAQLDDSLLGGGSGHRPSPVTFDTPLPIPPLAESTVEDGVRVFTIAYGPDADLATLQEISEASRAGTLPEPEPAAQADTATAGNTDPQTAEEPSSPEEQQPAPAADQTGESGDREHS